jgi:hypothetical protein
MLQDDEMRLQHYHTACYTFAPQVVEEKDYLG